MRKFGRFGAGIVLLSLMVLPQFSCTTLFGGFSLRKTIFDDELMIKIRQLEVIE